jgi:hypothetical protein
MEQLFSVVALVGMGIAVVWGLRLMARAGQANARRANPLSPSDLKLLEETTQRLMSELRAVADECVARIDAACQAAHAANLDRRSTQRVNEIGIPAGEAELLRGLRSIGALSAGIDTPRTADPT